MTMTRRDALKSAAAAAFLPAAGQAQTPDAVAQKLGDVVAREANGCVVHQITTAREKHSNIYCEVPYASKDSKFIVYHRTDPERKDNRIDFLVVELGTWKEHRLDTALTEYACTVSPDGVFYYVKRDKREMLLMKADLAAGKPEVVYRRPFGSWIRGLGTVSTDGRFYAGGVGVGDKNEEFGIVLLDMKEGKEAVIDKDPYIFNAHPQFEIGAGKQLLIQQNRGGKLAPDNKMIRSTGPEGATLYSLAVPEGKRTAMKIGPPHTTGITGHQAWIGDTGEVLVSVAEKGDFTPEKGNLLALKPGGDYRVVANGNAYNHVGMSRCGRLFSADDFRGDFNLIIGSPKTGKTAVLCPSRTVATGDQATHPHPYLTPDLKWMIFQSTRSGSPQVYAASVPEELIKPLLGA